MRIILHIGMPKAGSTALQHGLSGLRDGLVQFGALYPESPVLTHKHALVIGDAVPADAVPRLLRHKYDADVSRIKADAQAWWEHLGQQVRDVQPETVMLSDEWLFTMDDDRSMAALAQRLRTLADAVDVVAYVRQPSEYYASLTHQTLRASNTIRPVRPVEYRRTLEQYAKHVADAVHVFPYDRNTWPDGDILKHFLSKFVPSFGMAPDETPPRNESLSAEAIAVLADYRRTFWPHSEQRFTQDTRRLIRNLRLADERLGGAHRPELHPAIRDYLDRASTDLLWLRDTYGIVFDGVNYDAICDGPAPIEQPQRFEQICNVSEERKAQLTLHALRQFAEPHQTTP